MAEKTLGQVAYEAMDGTWCRNAEQSWQAGADAVIAAHEARRWRAIKSAPESGTPFLAWHEDWAFPDIGWRDGDGWCHDSQPTHWTPIPDADVANEGLSDTFLILGVPAEMAARKKAQEAALTTAAGLRRALEEMWERTNHPICMVALAASSDEHARRLKAEAYRDLCDGLLFWVDADVKQMLRMEADRLEAANG